MSDEIVIEYFPTAAPRRRLTFERAAVAGVEFWCIEEVYSVTHTVWRELGREAVAEPCLITVTGDRVPMIELQREGKS